VSSRNVDRQTTLALYLEGEDLRVTGTSNPPPAILRPSMLRHGRYWSGGRQLRVEATSAGQWVDLSFTVSRAGTYELFGELTKSTDGGIVDIFLDESPLATAVDLSAVAYRTSGRQPWGRRTLSAGDHTLRMQSVGANPRSTGNRFSSGLDYFELVPADMPALDKCCVVPDNMD
jgi:hypothetical protein